MIKRSSMFLLVVWTLAGFNAFALENAADTETENSIPELQA